MNIENFKNVSMSVYLKHEKIHNNLLEVMKSTISLAPEHSEKIEDIISGIFIEIDKSNDIIKVLSSFERFNIEYLFYLDEETAALFKEARKEIRSFFMEKKKMKEIFNALSQEEKESILLPELPSSIPSLYKTICTQDEDTDSSDVEIANTKNDSTSDEFGADSPELEVDGSELAWNAIEESSPREETSDPSKNKAYKVSLSLMIDESLLSAVDELINIDYKVIAKSEDDAFKEAKNILMDKILIRLNEISS